MGSTGTAVRVLVLLKGSGVWITDVCILANNNQPRTFGNLASLFVITGVLLDDVLSLFRLVLILEVGPSQRLATPIGDLEISD